ncbi:MAG TPA: hypothetical protein VFB63_33820 [Bryobacteraceae bacterium]|nr:hypothetical protein [Bryobacteraceae bacterium]
MECTAGDFGCEVLLNLEFYWSQFVLWLTGAWQYLAAAVPLLDRIVSVVSAIVNKLFELLGRHLQPLATLATTTFAIVKWYQSRESAQFKRLQEMLRTQDSRRPYAAAVISGT